MTSNQKPFVHIPNGKPDSKPVQATSPTAFKDIILTRHPRFYMSSGDVVFLVEKTLYRVHSCFFVEHSQMFEDILNSEKSTPVSREAYIQLNETITAAQFETFLSICYPAQLGVLEKHDETAWRNLLSFATACEFTSLITTALSGLDQHLHPVEKIILGDKLALPQLTIQGLREVCTRLERLNTEEGHALGVDNAICVAGLRELYLKSEKADAITDAVLKEALAQRDSEASALAAKTAKKDGLNGSGGAGSHPAADATRGSGSGSGSGGGDQTSTDPKKGSDTSKSQSEAHGAGAGQRGKGRGNGGGAQNGSGSARQQS
ncbi:hypothetical protein HWV62_11810 [Athelia sp. TMB]|nr:hypothetical protein HWV62_11810 [Athelia sp. TMB]